MAIHQTLAFEANARRSARLGRRITYASGPSAKKWLYRHRVRWETIVTTMDDDEIAIRNLIDDWSAAARRKDYDGVLTRHSRDILMFDVPGPFQSEGIEAYRKTWDLFFGWISRPPKFDFSDIRITAGADVAFATAHGKCFSPDNSGNPAELDFRLTTGLRKIGDEWIVEHEDHSVPAP